MAKPSAKPEWATSNPTDPTSGQLAIIEPSAGKKASGFLYQEEPPRQDHNWLFNTIDLWVDYFEVETDRNTSDIVVLQEDVINNASNISGNATGITAVSDALVIAESDIDVLESDMIVIQSDVAALEPIAAANASDLVIVNSDLTEINAYAQVALSGTDVSLNGPAVWTFGGGTNRIDHFRCGANFFAEVIFNGSVSVDGNSTWVKVDLTGLSYIGSGSQIPGFQGLGLAFIASAYYVCRIDTTTPNGSIQVTRLDGNPFPIGTLTVSMQIFAAVN